MYGVNSESSLGPLYLEVPYGLLQRAVVVQHHPSELERLDVVLVQHEGFLKTLHCGLKIPELSERKNKRPQDSNSL